MDAGSGHRNKRVDGKEVVVGRKSTEMTSAEIKWNLEQ